MKSKTFFRLYLIAAIAFVFALLKYSFWDSSDVSPMYFIFECVSFMGFLGIIYFADTFIRKCKSDAIEKEKKYEISKAELLEKINRQDIQIDDLLNKSGKKVNGSDKIEIFKKEIDDIINSQALGSDMANALFNLIGRNYEIGLGVCYFKSKLSDKYIVEGVYGLEINEIVEEFDGKSGINGQCISDKEVIVIKEIEDEYFNIESCSGSSKPSFLYLLPICKDKDVIGLLELATFKEIHIENHWEMIIKN